MSAPATLVGLLDELVAADADAVLALDADPAGAVATTRAQLRHRVGVLTADLQRAGVGPGDCVAVWLPNWSDALAWQVAVASLGAHVIGVNTRYNVDEVVHVLDRARPRVLALAHGFHGLDLLGRLRQAVAAAEAAPPAVVPVAGPHGTAPDDVAGHDVGGGVWLPTDPAAVRGTPAAPPPRDGSDLAVAFTTSGSTGMPKLAAHREDAVVGHAHADARALGVGSGDVALCVLPLSGVFGFNTALAAVAGGGACLFEPTFDPVRTLDDMAEHGVTHVVGGDDMVSRLTDAWPGHPVALPALRWLGLADFIGRSVEVAAWAAEHFGASATGVYGSSEVFALSLLWPPGEPAPRRWSGGGRPVSPEIRVRTADPDLGTELGPGEQGELQFRGPTVVDAYLGDPAAAQRAFTDDGWFRSGDLAVVDGDGGVEYVCRMGDVLRLSGFLVSPAEIEVRLADHPAVETAKVVGASAPGGATRAVAFVVLTEGRTAAPGELRDWCAATLAGFKVPAEVVVIDAMPTTSGTNGSKIRAATLRAGARQRPAVAP